MTILDKNKVPINYHMLKGSDGNYNYLPKEGRDSVKVKPSNTKGHDKVIFNEETEVIDLAGVCASVGILPTMENMNMVCYHLEGVNYEESVANE